MTTYLVTGASGEIGHAVVSHLRALNVSVRAMLRTTAKGAAAKALGAEVVIADLTDRPSLDRAVQGCVGVYHIGALYRDAGLPDAAYFAANADGTRALLDAAIAAGVERFVHTSTGGVLGDIKTPPGSHLTPYAPGDVYQRSKTEGEKIALEYFRSGKIRGVVIRPAMVYGPGDTRHLKLFRMIARGRFFFVGPGDKSVHFIDIRDLARAYRLAMERTEVSGEIYHIAGEAPLPLRDAVNLIADRLGVRRPWLHLPIKLTQAIGSACEIVCAPFGIAPPIYKRRVDFFTKARHFDTSKSARELGFHPSLPSRDEIVAVTDYFRAHHML
jgi:dihydroflavonol-4-reductase